MSTSKDQSHIDFVLVYEVSAINDQEIENEKKREIFEDNLRNEMLDVYYPKNKDHKYVLLHAPDAVLYKYAELLKIKMPLKKNYNAKKKKKEVNICMERFERALKNCKHEFGKLLRVKGEKRDAVMHMEFSRTYSDMFDEKHENFFDSSTRSSIINFILERQRFDGKERFENKGIERLLDQGVYTYAFSMHEEKQREKFLKYWANIKKWIMLQPLDEIKDYFGARVALYFAWLGFYTEKLIPISIFGLICLIYGLGSWSSDPISKSICKHSTIIMCPLCDKCNFWRLQDTCKSSKFNYLIDNKITILFSCVMSIWAVMYLQLWERYSATLVHRWGLNSFTHHVEHPRSQYLAKVDTLNNYKRKVTESVVDEERNLKAELNKDEPSETVDQSKKDQTESKVHWSVKCWPSITSYSILLLFITLSLIAIFGVIVYRMAQKASTSIFTSKDTVGNQIMLLPMTAGILDFVVISVLDVVYSALAVKLTDYEYCRTETEYIDNLTIKNYLFQFVNYYSSLFYIAFLKGNFVGYPSNYNRIFGYRQEECNPGGCLMELSMQLVIIMVGKQTKNSITEMLGPFLKREFNKFFNSWRGSQIKGTQNNEENKEDKKSEAQKEIDNQNEEKKRKESKERKREYKKFFNCWRGSQIKGTQNNEENKESEAQKEINKQNEEKKRKESKERKERKEKKEKRIDVSEKIHGQIEEEIMLLPANRTSLYEEYLEMVIQFGFITLFSVAFPLAPLLALINNIIEVRMDAIKMLKLMRRPVGMRAHDIGVWRNILIVVVRLSVLSNAALIAFGTNLIPKWVYRRLAPGDENLENYVNFTLTTSAAAEFPIAQNGSYGNITHCHYPQFRSAESPQDRPQVFWEIMVYRLAFIVIYQNAIFMLQSILFWAVRDVPGKLRRRIKMENFKLREELIDKCIAIQSQHDEQANKTNHECIHIK